MARSARCLSVTFAQIATANPMGQQAYESSIQAALLELADPDLELRVLNVSSLRNGVAADRRLAWGLLERSPASFAQMLGAWCYRGADLVHRLDLRLPPRIGPEVVTVHDLPGLRFDDEGSVPRFLAAGARSARAVIVPSTFAGQEVVDLLRVDPQRINVVPYGLSAVYKSPPAAATRSDLMTLPGPYVLHAAGATKRKNLASLAEAWRTVSAADPDIQLVLCGPPDARRDSLFAGAARVHRTGRLVPADVAWLMHRARAVVVPSTYEGFGLPALEGMAAGVPVIAANAGALPEVCGDGALLVEPDGVGLAGGILAVLKDDAAAADLRVRGTARAATFDWRAAARAHVDIYRSVA